MGNTDYLFITVKSSNGQMTIGGNKKLQQWFMNNNPDKWIPIKQKNMKLLDFYAEWCQPCIAMKPMIAELISEGVDVEKIDIDVDTERAQSFNVMSIPTLIIEEDGKEVKRLTGVQSKADIKKALGL